MHYMSYIIITLSVVDHIICVRRTTGFQVRAESYRLYDELNTENRSVYKKCFQCYWKRSKNVFRLATGNGMNLVVSFTVSFRS